MHVYTQVIIHSPDLVILHQPHMYSSFTLFHQYEVLCLCDQLYGLSHFSLAITNSTCTYFFYLMFACLQVACITRHEQQDVYMCAYMLQGSNMRPYAKIVKDTRHNYVTMDRWTMPNPLADVTFDVHLSHYRCVYVVHEQCMDAIQIWKSAHCI